MRAQDIIDAFHLPDASRVDQRIPKKLLLEGAAVTTADRRLVSDHTEEIRWIAALKPNTIGVPEYRDEQCEYPEIALLLIASRDLTALNHTQRLAELIHRAIPYPVLLLIDGESVHLSLAHKRWAQNEADKMVLEGDLISASTPDTGSVDAGTDSRVESAFLASLSLARQPQTNLRVLYQAWINAVHALLAARLTGRYKVLSDLSSIAARGQALTDHEQLMAEIIQLRAQAKKERQMARLVELNLDIKRTEALLHAAQKNL